MHGPHTRCFSSSITWPYQLYLCSEKKTVRVSEKENTWKYKRVYRNHINNVTEKMLHHWFVAWGEAKIWDMLSETDPGAVRIQNCNCWSLRDRRMGMHAPGIFLWPYVPPPFPVHPTFISTISASYSVEHTNTFTISTWKTAAYQNDQKISNTNQYQTKYAGALRSSIRLPSVYHLSNQKY